MTTRTATTTRPRPRRSVNDRCARCSEPVLWLTSVETGKRVALTPTPVPGGDLAVMVGTGMFTDVSNPTATDPNVTDPDAMPAYHALHSTVCRNVTYRRYLDARAHGLPAQRRSTCGRRLWVRDARAVRTCALPFAHQEDCRP